MTCKHLLQGAPDCVFCHRDQLQQEVNGLLVENSNVRGVRDQLLKELSLAEEGLANYAQEVEKLREEHRIWEKHSLVQVVEENQQLKRALNFWLPMIPEDAPLDESPVLSRIERDANLLFNFEGESDDKCAAELGWIELCVEAQIRELCPECLQPKPCAQHPSTSDSES